MAIGAVDAEFTTTQHAIVQRPPQEVVVVGANPYEQCRPAAPSLPTPQFINMLGSPYRIARDESILAAITSTVRVEDEVRTDLQESAHTWINAIAWQNQLMGVLRAVQDICRIPTIAIRDISPMQKARLAYTILCISSTKGLRNWYEKHFEIQDLALTPEGYMISDHVVAAIILKEALGERARQRSSRFPFSKRSDNHTAERLSVYNGILLEPDAYSLYHQLTTSSSGIQNFERYEEVRASLASLRTIAYAGKTINGYTPGDELLRIYREAVFYHPLLHRNHEFMSDLGRLLDSYYLGIDLNPNLT